MVCPDGGVSAAHVRRAALRLSPYDEYLVEVPFIDWNGQQLVPVSVQGCNAEADLDALMVTLWALIL